MNRKFLALLTVVLFTGFLASVGLSRAANPVDMKVHEWGTFTSVAGEDGAAVEWHPSGGPTDLPCFVDRSVRIQKGGFSGTVRMETPVLYFYASKDETARVNVGFPKGAITEWYPRRSDASASESSIEWKDVRISPSASVDFPVESSPSHYYAARKTDAAPLHVGPQQEKFLFYRGVGTFPLPVSAKISDDGRVLNVKNLGPESLNDLVLFENRGGRVRFQTSGSVHGEISMDLSALPNRGLADLETALERILVQQGLYAKEARAMIETWHDSWFEEGTRLFYIVPRHAIDAVLPLDIQPAPAELARVFVGRMEIITPDIRQDVAQAIARGDRSMLEKYGRFLEPISKRMGAKSALLDEIYSEYLSRASACRK